MDTASRRGMPEWLIASCGVWLVCLGLCFIFLRPSLLPEDTRFIGGSLTQVRASLPGLEGWLQRVFTVMGGFIADTGVLTVFLAWVAMPAGLKGTAWAMALAGVPTLVLMSATNFALHSDFRWLLLAPALVWLAGLVLHVARRERHRD
jgi:hypothetical protein